ncbi:hypothetical protein H4R23_002380, partial [Coemansia sp. Cherry 401B]
MSDDLLARHAARALAAMAADSAWQLPAADSATVCDEDDSWLGLDSDELDAAMRKAESVLNDASQGDQAAGPADGDSDGTAQDLQSMLAKFEAFLAADSGIEGADLADANSDDGYAENSDDDIDFDADGIIGALMEAV